MSLLGIDLVIVEAGHKLTCPKGVEYVVTDGSMVFDGKGKCYLTAKDFENVKAKIGGAT